MVVYSDLSTKLLAHPRMLALRRDGKAMAERRYKIITFISCCVFLMGTFIFSSDVHASEAQKTRLEQQRDMFQQARIALKAKDIHTLKQLLHDMGDYPLAPYLEVWQGYDLVKKEKDYDVWQILTTHKNLPETRYLRQTWVKSLAERGQWPQVSEQLILLPQGTKRFANIAVQSFWYNGHAEKARQGLTQLWRQAQPLPENETKLIANWHAAGHPSHDDMWARVVTWAKHGQWKKVKNFKHYLNVQEQKWIKLWEKVQTSPEHALLTSRIYHISPKVMAWIAKDGLRRLARHDIEKAWKVLQRIKPQLNDKDVQHLQVYLAIRAAKQHQKLASQWLLSLPNGVQNKETRAWLVRSLLLKKQWGKALQVMQTMPESEQMESRWLYWQGYVLEQLKQPETAKLLFEQGALERGYYSFLCAKHLHQPYQMGARKLLDVDTTLLQKNKAIQRAYEWRYWGESSKADAEWRVALKGASKKTWQQAMQLAIDWGWHEQVIRAASRSRQWDVLEARFPMAYKKEVNKAAHHSQLKTSLIWGIIRQESAFNPMARSRTGARGLMQLMPATAKDVVKKHRIRHRKGLNLSRPAHNIELGSLYIADMLKRFDGQQALAIAAYNAGPNRVEKWQKAMPLRQEALWVELIPFNETRRYVQHVLAFMVVYDWLQQQSASTRINLALTKAD